MPGVADQPFLFPATGSYPEMNPTEPKPKRRPPYILSSAQRKELCNRTGIREAECKHLEDAVQTIYRVTQDGFNQIIQVLANILNNNPAYFRQALEEIVKQFDEP